jgi:hypothetical protein
MFPSLGRKIAIFDFFKPVPFGRLTTDFPAARRAGGGRRLPSAEVFFSSKIVRQVARGGEKREFRSVVVTRDTVDGPIRGMVGVVVGNGLYDRSWRPGRGIVNRPPGGAKVRFFVCSSTFCLHLDHGFDDRISRRTLASSGSRFR